MRWILDSCTLIYLVKANLFKQFMELVDYPVVIDSSVYQEVIIDGKANNYPDAFETETYLNNYKIPIIPLDVSSELNRLIDIGETSCYILGKEDGVCLTSDDKAFKKFKRENLNVMRVDSFYIEMYRQKKVSETGLFDILKRLQFINATKPESIILFREEIEKEKQGERK